nr:hypothetical protein BGP89_04950 [Luteimonas sp. JM171]
MLLAGGVIDRVDLLPVPRQQLPEPVIGLLLGCGRFGLMKLVSPVLQDRFGWRGLLMETAQALDIRLQGVAAFRQLLQQSGTKMLPGSLLDERRQRVPVPVNQLERSAGRWRTQTWAGSKEVIK